MRALAAVPSARLALLDQHGELGEIPLHELLIHFFHRETFWLHGPRRTGIKSHFGALAQLFGPGCRYVDIQEAALDRTRLVAHHRILALTIHEF